MSDGTSQVTEVNLAYEGFQEGVRMILTSTSQLSFELWSREALSLFVPRFGPDGMVEPIWLAEFIDLFTRFSQGRCQFTRFRVVAAAGGALEIDVRLEGRSRTLLLKPEPDNPIEVTWWTKESVL